MIVFDSLLNAMPAPLRKLCVAFTTAVILACCPAFIVGGWQQTVINMDNEYPVLGISYAWLYGVAIVFGAGMALTVVLNLWSSLRSISKLKADLIVWIVSAGLFQSGLIVALMLNFAD